MDVDYRLAFELAPVGLCVSRNRAIVDCNAQLCEMFGWSRELLVGQSFLVLYPTADEYERLGKRIDLDVRALSPVVCGAVGPQNVLNALGGVS